MHDALHCTSDVSFMGLDAPPAVLKASGTVDCVLYAACRWAGSDAPLPNTSVQQ